MDANPPSPGSFLQDKNTIQNNREKMCVAFMNGKLNILLINFKFKQIPFNLIILQRFRTLSFNCVIKLKSKMIGKIRYIFVIICVFSLVSLTMQASIINFCKETKAVKFQKQSIPVTEEEEEEGGHDNDEVDEVFYFAEDEIFLNPDYIGYIRWSKSEHDYLSCIRKIPIPPPKF